MKEYSYGIVPYKIKDNSIYVLVSKSSKHSLYGFVKGKIENETLKECAVREFFEETNIKIDKQHLEKYFYQTYTRKNIGVFLCNSTNVNMSTLNLKVRQELYSVSYKKLSDKLYQKFQKNQRKIFSDICLYFKESKIFTIINQ